MTASISSGERPFHPLTTKELREKHKVIEMGNFKIDELKELEQTPETIIKILNINLECMRTKRDLEANAKDTLRERVKTLENESTELQEKCIQVETTLEKSEAELQSLKDELEKLKATIKEKDETNETLNETLLATITHLGKTNFENESLKKQFPEAKKAKQIKYDELLSLNAAKEAELVSARNLNSRYLRIIKALDDDYKYVRDSMTGPLEKILDMAKKMVPVRDRIRLAAAASATSTAAAAAAPAMAAGLVASTSSTSESNGFASRPALTTINLLTRTADILPPEPKQRKRRATNSKTAVAAVAAAVGIAAPTNTLPRKADALPLEQEQRKRLEIDPETTVAAAAAGMLALSNPSRRKAADALPPEPEQRKRVEINPETAVAVAAAAAAPNEDSDNDPSSSSQ